MTVVFASGESAGPWVGQVPGGTGTWSFSAIEDGKKTRLEAAGWSCSGTTCESGDLSARLQSGRRPAIQLRSGKGGWTRVELSRG